MDISFDSIRNNGDLLFESIRGSHLFGLNTEESDVDTFGVFCGPEDWFLGNGKDRVEMVKSEKSDDYWDELGKYFFELGKSNPEALVSLFTPEKFILHFDPVLQPLWDIRDQLLTKECFKSFSGYAYSQIKKAKGLKKAINTNPEEVKERKNPLYFCQVPVGIGTHTLKKWIEDRGLRQECCGISRLPNSNECYALFYDWGKARELGDDVCNDNPIIGYRGILSTDDPLTSQLRLSSIPKEEKPLCWFQFNSNAYTSHCVEYKRYWDWVKNRNQKRFEMNTGHNYDCYLATNTKFLTNHGWKFYEKVEDGDLIACFDENGNLRYSEIKSRFRYDLQESKDSTEIFKYKDLTNNIAFSVTLNHKLCLRREDQKDYKLITVEEWLREKDTYKFYQRSGVSISSEESRLSLSQIFTLGYCLRSGAIVASSDNGPYVLISPVDLKMCKLLTNTFGPGSSISIKFGLGQAEIHEKSDLFDLLEGIITEVDQRDSFLNSLSDEQLEEFFRGYNYYYVLDQHNYTNFFKADKALDAWIQNGQLMLYLRGWHCYKIDGYKFLFRKSEVKEVLLDPTKYTISKYKYNSVVCFESETGTLVTSGFIEETEDWGIAFHGNSKNMSHCVRIFTMATEIAQGKGMILDRTGIDREFLMSIKNHELSYDEMFKYVEDLKDRMEETFEKSNLPESPDLDLLNKIMIQIRKSHYGRKH